MEPIHDMSEEDAKVLVRTLPPDTLANLTSACIERPEGEDVWVMSATWIEWPSEDEAK